MPSTRYSGIWTLTQAQQAVRNQNWTNIPPPNVEFVVVAGGGGGGGSYGGGGGAGGFRSGFTGITTGSAITVTVGAGGSAQSNGSDSVFGAITAQAGGAGGGPGLPGNNGGSGGGAGGSGGGSFHPGIGTSGQGNNGGAITGQSGVGPAGGGGGAGVRGSLSVQNVAGNGGGGIASIISGTRTTYAGGGGGGIIGQTAGSGGQGGGGSGSSSGAGSAGTANTGGGGGGGGGGASAGGAGGSGIVIISYPDIYAPAVSTTGSPTVTTSGSGSLYFDGTGDYLAYANGSFYLTNNNFVIESFFYVTSSGGFYTIAGGNTDLATQTGSSWNLTINNTGTLSGTLYSGSTLYQITTAAVSQNVWNHIAFVRTGGTISLFLNGVKDGTNTTLGTSSINNGSNTYPPCVGANGQSNTFLGYLSNTRIIIGTIPSSYDATASTITVPNAPLPAVSNTQLLLSTVSGAQFNDSSGNNRTATVAGNTVWNALSPFVTGAGFKNRVYQWTSSGSVTF